MLLSIWFFDNKLIQASLCTATFLTSQATTFSKLLEQYKKQAAAAGWSGDLHKCKLFAGLQAISDHFQKVDHIFSKLFQ